MAHQLVLQDGIGLPAVDQAQPDGRQLDQRAAELFTLVDARRTCQRRAEYAPVQPRKQHPQAQHQPAT
ncbi:hypothetical protein B0X78_00755 [bacterium AM6]|nr:hypothetical protein B0X78_00755 [bacterium AM6]